ncbi:MAG: hypothetical protein LBL47_03380 [Lactobacillus sp.]|jgi:hypothetical protein|nr:hypothetical protein [Lactobacillus sp.]
MSKNNSNPVSMTNRGQEPDFGPWSKYMPIILVGVVLIVFGILFGPELMSPKYTPTGVTGISMLEKDGHWNVKAAEKTLKSSTAPEIIGAGVWITESTGKSLLLSTGEKKFEGCESLAFEGNLYYPRKGGMKGMYDASYKEVYPIAYKNFAPADDYFILLAEGYGIGDKAGKVIIAPNLKYKKVGFLTASDQKLIQMEKETGAFDIYKTDGTIFVEDVKEPKVDKANLRYKDSRNRNQTKAIK